MSKEAKIGLSLIFVLVCAFGFIIYKRLNPDEPQWANVEPINSAPADRTTAPVDEITLEANEDRLDPFETQGSDHIDGFTDSHIRTAVNNFSASNRQVNAAESTNSGPFNAENNMQRTYSNQFPSRPGATRKIVSDSTDSLDTTFPTDPLENTFGSESTTTVDANTRPAVTSQNDASSTEFANQTAPQDLNMTNLGIGSGQPDFSLEESEKPQILKFGSDNLNDADTGQSMEIGPEASNPLVEDDLFGLPRSEDFGAQMDQQDVHFPNTTTDTFGNPLSPGSDDSNDDVNATRQRLVKNDQFFRADEGFGNEEPNRDPVRQETFDDKRFGDFLPLQTSRQQEIRSTTIQPSIPHFGGSTVPNSGEYQVQPNDTYWIISKKVYGTARYFQALAQYNQQRISNPHHMRPGLKILTPSLTDLEERYPELFESQQPTTSHILSDTGQSPAESMYQLSGLFYDHTSQLMYRVGSKDTLTSISKDHLGRASRWIQIYRLNQHRLKNPDKLKIGTVLQMPADASRVKLVRMPGDIR